MMIALVLSLITSSVVGTFIWIIQSGTKSITQKWFSPTWHYYTGLIPVFFLLGGSEIINRLVPFIRSVLPATRTGLELGVISESSQYVTPIEQTGTNSSLFMKQLFDFLLRFDNLKEFALIASVTWAVGTTVFLLVNIHKYRTFKRMILQDSWVHVTEHCPVKVIVSAHATTPMAMGLWKPVIVLPDTSFGEKELAMILSHELVHIKRSDLLVKLLVLVANAVHWFNPAAYSLNKQLNALCELSCDEKVVRKMNMDDRKFYGETLLSMLEYGVMQKNVVCTSSLCNPKKYMKRRLLNLMNVKKTNKSMIMLSLIATMLMIGSGGAAAYAAGSAIPLTKEFQGANVTVTNPDGTVVSFDNDGKRVTAQPKDSYSPKKLTLEEIEIRIKKHIEKGITVPQGYIDELPQKNLDALNETYGLKLQKSNVNK